VFRLMRNAHLATGILCAAMAAVFAVSSLVIIYRRWLPTEMSESELNVAVSPDRATTPRALALVLMREHGLRGELRQIEAKGEAMSFRIVRPGTEARVQYDPASGLAAIRTSRSGALQMLVQLHTNHGLWHEFLPSQAWAALSLLASIGLLLLGVSGLYLWFSFHEERVIGTVLLAAGLVYGLVTLTLTRLAG
jgi:hypothetical protein